MKKNTYALLSVAVLLSVVILGGCKKDEDPVTPTEDKKVPNDVFPLTAGHRFDYSGYFTTQDTETPIAGTNAFYSTSWTIGATTPLAAVFGTQYGAYVASKNGGRASAVLIMDSTLTAPGGAKKFTPIFAYYDTATGDYYYMTNFGLFFRGSVVKDSASAAGVRMDSLKFIKLASPSAGLGGSFTAHEGVYTSYANPSAPTNITLTVTGKWESKGDVTVNGVTYPAYYLIISRTAKVGTATVSSGVTAKLWLAQGIGPVKMFLAGDVEVPGNFRELKSKNF